MGKKSAIEWTDETWNPLGGCSKISPGCKNCYAEKMAARLQAMGLPLYEGVIGADGHWSGRINLGDQELMKPLWWRKGRRVFVNSMSDLFHEGVPFEFIDQVFAVMALCPQHTFQVLTKRPERMAEYLRSGDGVASREECIAMSSPQDLNGRQVLFGKRKGPFDGPANEKYDVRPWPGWPLPNVWLGTSVENQAVADERIPALLGCPAAVRFLSCEPLLGAVDIRQYLQKTTRTHFSICVDGALRNKSFDGFTHDGGRWMTREEAKAELLRLQAEGVQLLPMGACEGFSSETGCPGHPQPRIDWVICGGESGKDARPMHPDWARDLREQCVDAGTKFFFKQWGEWAPHRPVPGGNLGGDVRSGRVRIVHPTGESDLEIFDRTGGRNTIPGSQYMGKVGKKASGRVLDGRTWDEMPGGGVGGGRTRTCTDDRGGVA
ncbi:MAG: phage Gp37/Gp68 family protein [Candidatus Hydrogenedentes bacterium]|nr:phage Gp37/Gp68 family protein [Candidatus Hydrogenedentota bacterium]